MISTAQFIIWVVLGLAAATGAIMAIISPFISRNEDKQFKCFYRGLGIMASGVILFYLINKLFNF